MEQTENMLQLPCGPMEVICVRQEGILTDCMERHLLIWKALESFSFSRHKRDKARKLWGLVLGVAVSKTNLNSQWQGILPEDWDRRVETVQNDITSCCY